MLSFESSALASKPKAIDNKMVEFGVFFREGIVGKRRDQEWTKEYFAQLATD